MPRTYRRKPGSRRYVDYSEEKLQECLLEIKSKLITQRKAAAKYNIPRSTIKNKLKNKSSRKPGHPTVFTEYEEKSFVAHITAVAEFGFPLTDIDLIFIIRDYLASQGRHVKEFTNNTPGREWVKSFLKRHHELSQRFANNIKRVRAQVSAQVIEEFIENLTPVLESVPPENIYNYDESNLTDDPGKKTVICRRGSKYPERVVNSTKLSYTVMFCGNAAGEVIPPYVIYKADHLWSTWMENGPEGARYNRTKSGWMDCNTFEDWFITLLLPILKKKEGRKVIIGDNLSSHINRRVLLECEKNDIAFVCLPPNATHILQPLDVAYFRPLKIKWRQILTQWKDSQQGRKLPTTPKEVFPNLLKNALNGLTDTKANLSSGFKRSGIYPQDKEEPLKRLPRQDRIVHPELITESFLQKLDHLRRDDKAVAKKKRKLNVPPGKSICAKDMEEAGPSSAVVASSSDLSKTKKVKKKRRESSTTECSDQMSLASSTEDLITGYEEVEDSEDDLPLSRYLVPKPQTNALDEHQLATFSSELRPETINNSLDDPILAKPTSELRPETDKNEHNANQPLSIKKNHGNYASQSPNCDENEPLKYKDYNINDYVLVKWNTAVYPGQITSLNEEGAMVSCLKKGTNNYWRWPVYKDEQLYSWDYIVTKISLPKFVKKGSFSISEVNDYLTK